MASDGLSVSRWLYGIVCLHALGLFFFSRGYLISRIELQQRSQCDDPIPQPSSDSVPSCWRSAVYDKLVVVVIDGLRFDAVVDANCDRTTPPPLHVAKFPKLLQRIEGHGSKIFKFVADPPTATTQRIKALLTGGLPTLIDTSDTFSGKSVTEDNLLSQLKGHSKRLLAVGDETWDFLFHDLLDISHPYESYNVKDMHTVDNAEFYPLVLDPAVDWDFAAGHYLGSDHACHLLGVESQAVASKMDEMDEDISNFLDQLLTAPHLQQDRILMLVFGDHGMTLSGQHGGGSAEEVESVLVAVDIQQLRNGSTNRAPSCPSSCVEDLGVFQMDQIDLTPSLAFLLGVPIPYANVGKASLELLKLGMPSASEGDLLQLIQTNAWQVNRYLNSYAEVAMGSFSSEIQKLNGIYNATLQSADSLESYLNYLDAAAEFARVYWTQFQDFSILLGMALLALSLCSQLGSLQGIVNKTSVVQKASVALLVLQGISFFSNSFIETEGLVIGYMLVSLALVSVREYVVKGLVEKRMREIVALLGTVLTLSWVIAPIGIAKHKAYTDPETLTSQTWLPYVGYLFLPILVKTMDNIPPGRQLSHRSWISSIFRLQICLVALHWLQLDVEKPLLASSDAIACLVYALSLSNLLMQIVTKLCMNQRSWSTVSVLILALLPPVLLLSGKLGCLVITFVIWQLCGFRTLIFEPALEITPEARSVCFGLVGHFSALQIFFFTRHFCEFSGLQFTVGFVGLSEFNFYASGALLALETFSGFLLIPLLLTQLAPAGSSPSVLAVFSFCRGFTLLQSMASANLMRRHLWSIRTFAPKLVFEMAFLIVSDLVLMIISVVLTV